MARKTMWAFAGALLAFAPLASATTYGMSVDNARTYATEVITGADVEIDYDGDEPTLVISITFDSATEVDAVNDGDALDVKITLTRAKFGENVRDGNMDVTDTVGGCTVDTEGRPEDGSQGESTVTFRIEADGDCTGSSGAVTMRFELPTLEGLTPSTTRSVEASVETAAGGGSGWEDTEDSGVETDPACSATVTTNCVEINNGALRRRGTSAALVSYAEGLTFVGTSSGSTASIDLAGGRTNFVRSRPATLGSVEVGVATAGACAPDETTDELAGNCTRQSDGGAFSIGRGGEGQGSLMVHVIGDFREGDTVWLEHDGTSSAASAREMLDLQDDGSMTGTFDLTDVAGNPLAAVGDAGEVDREEGVATRALMYAPNGEDALRPATFRSSFMVDFDRDASDKAWEPSFSVGADGSVANEFKTAFTVVEDTQHAYAIPELGATDEGNVRIKCEVATECTVYLECDDTAGASRFAQIGDPIAGRSTMTLNAAALAEELDFGDDGWEGNLSCTVYSTREITVQVLVRSADTLVNQTYIEND